LRRRGDVGQQAHSIFLDRIPPDNTEMKIRVLGCSGGIGGQVSRTTSLLLDGDVLIDCGTGIGDLPIDELARIDHVFLTHSHLDHIAGLPLLIDTVGDLRSRPLTVHASSATLEILRRHVFNWAIWPDFSEIPSRERPHMVYSALAVGERRVFGGRTITALPANHTVPAVGYQVDSGIASLVFSGDTGPCPALWTAVNSIANLRYLIVESAFPDRDRHLATASRHLCPSLLAAELAQLQRPAEIFITHLKPGQAGTTMREIEATLAAFRPRMLEHDQVFEI
jgi:ribonuclease BN (tRNA processing enzyme)